MSETNSVRPVQSSLKPVQSVARQGFGKILEPFTSQRQYNLENPEEEKVVAKTEEVKTQHWYDGFVRLFYWYPSYMPKDEKILLFKLDVILLLYVCSSYFTKSLDKSNLIKGYNSNMDVAINFNGNDLSYAKSLYSAGYIVSMCMGMMLVTRPWAQYSLPVLETIWGVLTFCEGVAKNSSQMFALRFLIGLAEGPIFPSVVYTIGSWYKRNELYRRMMCFSVSASIGGIFSGFLQSAAFQHLDGKGGYEGWQWGFFIDGIFTVPIALLGFAFYPGSLEQSGKVWWLKKSEKKLAHTRMVLSGVRPASTKLSWNLVKRVFLRWHVHYFTMFWVLLNIVALPDGTAFDLWLKEAGYDESQRTNYPSFQSVTGIVVQFFVAGLSDTFPPYIFLTIVQSLFIISYASLAAWNIPVGWRWVCYMIVGLDTCNQTLVSGQINRSVRRDADERAFVIGFSDAVSQAMNIWTNIAFYPTSKAPEFHLGFIISTIAAAIMLVMPLFQYFLDNWDIRRYAADDLEFARAHNAIPGESDSDSDSKIEDVKVTSDVREASVHSGRSSSA